MKRKCEIISETKDGKRAICIDIANQKQILKFIKQSDRHKKKWQHIVSIILDGHRNTELYDKEEISDKCKGVTAMKFFKGQENARLYCKEQVTENGIFIIVAAELLLRKKSQKVPKKHIPLIEKVGSYEYEIKSSNENQS